MPDLTFTVEGAEAIPFAAAPLLALTLQVRNGVPDEAIHSVVLRAQIQIEATRRHYADREKENLRDLFGEPDRWSRTLRSMLWTHASTVLQAFTGTAVTRLQIPCTFDFNVAATKYFYGVTEGDIPLNLLFSGTVFYAGANGVLQAAPIPWDKEARFRLPVQIWRDMMDFYYPNSAWLSLPREAFERLYTYKVRNGMQTWDEVLSSLLPIVEEMPVRR